MYSLQPIKTIDYILHVTTALIFDSRFSYHQLPCIITDPPNIFLLDEYPSDTVVSVEAV